VRGFNLGSIFYIRDLTMFFWPRHLWIRNSLLSGHWPLWDPYAAAGQAVFPDALNQLFLPPVLLLRLLSPAALSFNLIVIAPFPLAAFGMWLFLRRRFSSMSAVVGGAVYSLSGPVISTGNFPNLSWSIAWIPWMLWAVDRDRVAPSIRSFALVVAMTALQILSGEPVTMVGTLVLLGAYGVACGDFPDSTSSRRAALRAVAAVAVALVVSAVQVVPMLVAAQSSPRGLMRVDNFWSVHPLSLVETLLPHVFGDTFHSYNAQVPWVPPLNSGRDPFFYSLYMGPGVLLLAFMGALTGRRRWRFFWLGVVVVGTLLAFGDYAPVYPALQQLILPIRSFRFPAKFLIFVSLGIAMLSANATDLLSLPSDARKGHPSWHLAGRATIGAAIVCVLALIALVSLVMVAPFTGARAFYTLATMIGLSDPVAGAEFMFHSVPPVGTRALLLLITGALLAYLGWSARRESVLARAILFVVAIGEVVVVNAGVNPVLPASRLDSPAWTSAVRDRPGERFYFGGKFRGSLLEADVDLRGVQVRAPRADTVEEGRAIMDAMLAMTPAAWNIRELVSYDLPQLWPVEYARAVALFERSDRSERLRFLERGGVRYCLLSSPPRQGAVALRAVAEELGQVAVYECVPNARRAYVVPTALVVPDVQSQISRLFDESFNADASVMLVEPPPDPAGSPAASETSSARITLDGDDEVLVEVSSAAGGYLVLNDSFAPSWHVEVDGAPARLLRANALYRAVRLAPGPHSVRFSYTPVLFYTCLFLSGTGTIALGALALSR
jgi:hypothetical protein